MEIHGLFKLLAIVVLVLIALGVVTGGLVSWDIFGKGKDSLTEAEKMARILAAAQESCPGGRMSGYFEEELDSAGYSGGRAYRDLEGVFECNIEEAPEAECVIVGVYRREWVADAGAGCPSGWGDNVGSYEFVIDVSGVNYDFKPDCDWRQDTLGCCVKGKRAEGSDGLCEWYNYEWTYYNNSNSLNITVPNGVSAGVWSSFSDKADGGGDHRCYNKNFYTESYAYDKGLLKVGYIECCPKGWIWNKYYEKCCSDRECTNIFCISPAIYDYGVCWMVSEPGESCEMACARTGKECAPIKLRTAVANGMGADCELHAEAGFDCAECYEASEDTNSLAPYVSGGECYHYNQNSENFLSCENSEAGMQKVCPCRFSGEINVCDHMICPEGMCCDEDGGDYDLRGCAVNEMEEKREYCYTDDRTAPVGEDVYSDWLLEYYCDEGSEILEEFHNCGPDQCVNGACIT